MNLNRIKLTMATGMLAASMVLPGMTAFAAAGASEITKDGTKGNVATAQIEKTVDIAEGVTSIPEADKNITFEVEQIGNTSGNAAPNEDAKFSKYNVTVDVSSAANANGKSSSVKFNENILTKDILDKLTTGEYTFKITEATKASDSDFGWTTVNKNNNSYYLRVIVDKDGKAKYFLNTEANGASKDDYSSVDKKENHADFENVYNKKSVDKDDPTKSNTLTVTKTVTNPHYVSTNNTYPVTVTFNVPTTQNKVTENTSYKVTVQGKGGATTTTTASWNYANGVVTITASLEDGESIVVSDIAVGATYSVSESFTTDNDKNFKEVKYSVNGGTDATSVTNEKFAEASQTVDVKNTFNDVTVTGVATSIAPYITLVVLAVVAVAAYMSLKKRIAR